MIATDVTAPGDVAPGELGGHGPAIAYRQLDVTDPGGWAALAAHLRGRYGRVDAPVNNAGLTHRARLLDVELPDWEPDMGRGSWPSER